MYDVYVFLEKTDSVDGEKIWEREGEYRKREENE